MGKYIIDKIRKINSLFLDAHERIFINFAKNKWLHEDGERSLNGELLIDAMPYYPYIFKTAYVANFLSSEYKLEIKTIVTDYPPLSLFQFLRKFKFKKIYNSFGCSDGLNYTSLSRKEVSYCVRESRFLANKIESKQDLLELIYEGIKIGDLVYDNYLRQYSCSTVDIRDKRLFNLIKAALIIFHSCKKYIDSHNVKVVVLTHPIYIQFGILARLACQKGIEVFLFPIRSQIFHKLSPPYCLKNNYMEYRDQFSMLSNPKERLEKAKSKLALRLSGVIDAGISYMKSSAYNQLIDQSHMIFHDTGRLKVIIMLHCFFDSPHIYRDMLFPDFYEWIDFTLAIAEQTNFDFYVKPHPNGLPGNEKIVEYFEKKYPKITFIDKDISNNQIISEGIDAAITLYGTVGHEFTYLGVPVITAGDNPHSAYGFCNHARSVAEYEWLLRNIGRLPKRINKTEIEEFFYMHYLHPGSGRLEGSNDLFGYDKRNVDRESNRSCLLSELVEEAEMGKFDNVIPKLTEAISKI